MARAFTSEQKALLRSADCQVNALATFYLDEGTYRFCDDMAGFDLTDGEDVYIGASALIESVEIRGSQSLVAEGVTITVDGNRMTQYGVTDPAAILRQMLDYLYQQRRVDWAFGFRYSYSQTLNLIIPAFAGKINTSRLIDKEIDFGAEGSRTSSQLIIELDSLAARYNRASNRLRAHEDQLEIDPTDNFYSYTVDVALNERTIYWGKSAPFANGRPATGLAGAVYNALAYKLKNRSS